VLRLYPDSLATIACTTTTPGTAAAAAAAAAPARPPAPAEDAAAASAAGTADTAAGEAASGAGAAADERYADIEPRAGRLLLFDSRLEHEVCSLWSRVSYGRKSRVNPSSRTQVLPAHAPRFAVTVWLRADTPAERVRAALACRVCARGGPGACGHTRPTHGTRFFLYSFRQLV